MREFIRYYLLFTKYETGRLVPIEKIISDPDLIDLHEYLAEDKNNRYKLELTLLPRMISNSKIYIFKNRKISHINIKYL